MIRNSFKETPANVTSLGKFVERDDNRFRTSISSASKIGRELNFPIHVRLIDYPENRSRGASREIIRFRYEVISLLARIRTATRFSQKSNVRGKIRLYL